MFRFYFQSHIDQHLIVLITTFYREMYALFLFTRQRIDKMEAQLANLAALVQTQTGIRPGVSMSNSSLVSDSASAKSSMFTIYLLIFKKKVHHDDNSFSLNIIKSM